MIVNLIRRRRSTVEHIGIRVLDVEAADYNRVRQVPLCNNERSKAPAWSTVAYVDDVQEPRRIEEPHDWGQDHSATAARQPKPWRPKPLPLCPKCRQMVTNAVSLIVAHDELVGQ